LLRFGDKMCVKSVATCQSSQLAEEATATGEL
jgi:hypothetical protein